MLSRGYRWLAGRLLGLGGLDSEAGFKFFERARSCRCSTRAEDPGWFWDTEIIALALRRGLRIVQVPCLFQRRADKRSTLRVVPATVDYLRQLLALRRRLREPAAPPAGSR